jgi:hypothetical protein
MLKLSHFVRKFRNCAGGLAHEYFLSIQSKAVGSFKSRRSDRGHYTYTGKQAICEGVVPFQVAELVFDTADGKKVIPSELDMSSFIPEEQVTESVLISWLEQRVPEKTLETFRKYIAERIAQMES